MSRTILEHSSVMVPVMTGGSLSTESYASQVSIEKGAKRSNFFDAKNVDARTYTHTSLSCCRLVVVAAAAAAACFQIGCNPYIWLVRYCIKSESSSIMSRPFKLRTSKYRHVFCDPPKPEVSSARRAPFRRSKWFVGCRGAKQAGNASL